MNKLLALLLLLPAMAQGGWYVDLGIGAHIVNNGGSLVASEAPLGRFAVGYDTREWDVHYGHTSSVPYTRDVGLDTVTINRRFRFE